MAGEQGPFALFYASAWQHPLALWIAVAVGAAVARARRDLHASVRRYCLALALLSTLDAWLTANHVMGLGALPARLATMASLFFVLAGDFRYLLLLESATPGGSLVFSLRGIARAAMLTAVVPIFAQLAAPAVAPGSPRVLFFVYELAFCALTAALLRWHPNARAQPWLRAVSAFVLVYYGLWAASDAIILATGADLGHALRVIPNLLYYGGLIAAIARFAPVA